MIHITDSQTDRILDVIDEDEFWDDKHYKSLKDTLETFDFTTFANKRFSEHLAKRNRIIIPDEDGKYVEFVIEETRKYRDTQGGLFVEVFTSATYITLAKAKVIKLQTTPAWTAEQHAKWSLSGTEWEIGEVAFAGTRTLTIDQHTNPYAYLKRLATEFNLELHFRVEVDGNKVVRRYVDLVERVGTWNGREVEFGKDLTGIERKEDFSNIVTALIGLGPEREDGTRLEVFVEDKDALARWGRNGQHLIDVYEPESTDSTMTEERLRELTQNELEKRVNSVVEYTADIVYLEKVSRLENEKIRFGDTLRIKDTQFVPPLYLEARVHTMERSIKKNGYKTVTLGDYIEYTEEEVMAIWKALQAEIVKKVSLSDVMEVTYTKTEIDDKDAGVYQDSTYYADNVSETKKQEAIQVAATDATNKANTAEQNAKNHADSVAMNTENNAKNHADSVAEQKKQEAIQQAVADAETKINTAKMELEADIALKADAEWVNGQLVLKENAITKSNTAPSNPTTGQLWLDTSVTPNVLKRWSGSAWVKATPTSAGEVGAYTKTEVDNALNSKVSVTQYTTDMNGVITRLDSAESRITQTENEIATKVSNTQYQQDKAALESDIFALETRVTNAETSITQLSDQIQLKAEQTTVDTLENRISSAESTITLLSDEIDLKVNKDGVISAINVSSEGVRISGNKVTIDGTTNIANGVIKTAHIESLTFDKLRGGTATLGGSGNNGSLEVLGADNSVIFRASRDGLVGSGGQPIITKNGLISSFTFVSSGDVNGWQRCGWWDYGPVGRYEQAYIRFRIPVNFTVTNAVIYVYSMPIYISGHPGITTGYYHTRYIKLFKINNITNQFFDMPFASDIHGIVVRSGSATDISSTVWGKSRWDPQVEGTVSRIQVIGGGITSLVDPGYNEFFVKSDSAIKDQRNSSLIQIMVIIEGYQSR